MTEQMSSYLRYVVTQSTTVTWPHLGEESKRPGSKTPTIWTKTKNEDEKNNEKQTKIHTDNKRGLCHLDDD